MTSIMKSEPARSLLDPSTVAGAGWAAAEVTACWAMAIGGLATSPAAPAAAPLKKPRRSTKIFLDFAMQASWFLPIMACGAVAGGSEADGPGTSLVWWRILGFLRA